MVALPNVRKEINKKAIKAKEEEKTRSYNFFSTNIVKYKHFINKLNMEVIKIEGIKRTTNFSTTEIQKLLELVDKKKDTIECKKTDRTSSEEKNNAWLEIEAEFNSTFDSFRSFKNLKTKYENLKKTAKKNYATDKQELYRTGGGPQPASQVSTFDENVMKIVQEEQIVGHESIYDDDFIPPSKLENTQTEEEIYLKEAVECVIEEEPKANLKWDKYSPKMLKSKKHEALYTGEKRQTKDVWASVGELKIKKLKLEISVIEEEWKLKKTKYELEISQLKKNEQNESESESD